MVPIDITNVERAISRSVKFNDNQRFIQSESSYK